MNYYLFAKNIILKNFDFQIALEKITLLANEPHVHFENVNIRVWLAIFHIIARHSFSNSKTYFIIL